MINAQVMKTILLAFMRFMSSDCYFHSIFAIVLEFVVGLTVQQVVVIPLYSHIIMVLVRQLHALMW